MKLNKIKLLNMLKIESKLFAFSVYFFSIEIDSVLAKLLT